MGSVLFTADVIQSTQAATYLPLIEQSWILYLKLTFVWAQSVLIQNMTGVIHPPSLHSFSEYVIALGWLVLFFSLMRVALSPKKN